MRGLPRSVRPLVTDGAQVLALTAAGGLLLRALVEVLDTSPVDALSLLGSATAAVASSVALLSAVVGRLRGDRQLAAAGWAWGFFALVVTPLSAVNGPGAGPAPWPAVSAVATAGFLGLFASAVWARPSAGHGRRLVRGGVAGLVLGVVAAPRVPVATLGQVTWDSAEVVFLAGWTLLGYRCVTLGLRRAEPVWWRTGFGLVTVAAGHLLGVVAGGPGRSALLPASTLLGVLVLAVGLARYTQELVRERRDRQVEQAEVTALAARAEAERSHEIRNALSNLSAITTLLADSPGATSERFRPAGDGPAAAPGAIGEIIQGEFARLHDLLETSSAVADAASAPVDRVLSRLVTLRRLTGSVITLSCPPGLVAALPAATLAQVVTNLLANCARHAPGAEIRVTARRVDGVCLIEVADAGPGLLALQGETGTTGSGLGLELSSQLVGDYGGSLQLMPATQFPSGTTARLCLPLVAGEGSVRFLGERTAS